jgi:hypothetical protein
MDLNLEKKPICSAEYWKQTMQIHSHRLAEQPKKRNSLNITEITISNNMKNNKIQVS